jgi:hypothetical protein
MTPMELDYLTNYGLGWLVGFVIGFIGMCIVLRIRGGI